MANVKTTKAPAKKATRKKAAPKATPTLNEADLALVGDIAAKAAAAAVAAAMPAPEVKTEVRPGKKLQEKPIKTADLTPDVTADWTDEQIAEFNRREQERMRSRKEAQSRNRERLEDMSHAERIKFLLKPRDPSVTREARPPGYDGDLVKVRCLRKVGLNDNGEMSDVDEEVLMPPENARALQKAGAVEVVI